MRIASALLFVVVCSATAAAQAQTVVPCQTYRLEYQTVVEERQVTAYRVDLETVYDEQQVTTYRPVWETECRERRYRVAKPVVETSEREERYTVQKPVWETQVRDESYDVVRTVYETEQREQRYTVQKPVWETQEREERYTVRRPVYETAEQEQNYTVMQPVTTYQNVQVDQGGWVDQQVCIPGPVRNRLTWQPGACVVDPATGASTFHRRTGGFRRAAAVGHAALGSRTSSRNRFRNDDGRAVVTAKGSGADLRWKRSCR
jgi:hypothetical protein